MISKSIRGREAFLTSARAGPIVFERYLGVKYEETAQAISVLDIPSLKALAAPQVATPNVKQIATPIEIAISRVS